MRFTSAVRSSKRLQLTLTAAAVLLAGAAVLLLHAYIRDQHRQRGFQYEIRLTERLIADRRLEPAERRLAAAAELASDEAGWLQVLKRAQRIDELRGRTTLLHAYAERAAEAFPDAETLQAVAVEAALRSGAYAEAADRAAERLESAEHAALLAEALVAAGAYPADPTPDELETLHPLVRLVAAETPERHLQAHELTGDARFAVNAALLFLARGNAERAAEVLDRAAIPPEAALVAALVAYELGEYERASVELARLPGETAVEPPALLLHAELELRAGRTEAARLIYEELLVTDPDQSRIAWYNLAALLDEPVRRRALLAEALQRFPEDLRMVSAYVAAGGDPETVVGGLDPPYRALFRFYADPEAASGARAVALLWDLHNEYPDNNEIAAELARKLVAVSDRSGLERVLNRFAGREGALWARQYEGWLARRRDAGEALGEAVAAGFAPRRLWQSAHNRAVYALLQRDAAGVAQALSPAEAALAGLPGYHEQRAKLRHLRALGAYLEGDPGRAREYLVEAIAEDPRNFELRRFLRNLETGMQ